MKIVSKTYTIEWLLNFASSYTQEKIPEDIKPHLHRLLSAPCEYDDTPITRSCASVILSLTPQTLAVKASIGDFSIPFHKSGRNVRYPLKGLRDFISSNTYKAEV